MKNLFKKPLAIVIALAIVLTSVSIAAVAATNYDVKFTVYTKFYDADNNPASIANGDGTNDLYAKEGDVIRADFLLTSDFKVGNLMLYVRYNDKVLEPDTATYRNGIGANDIGVECNESADASDMTININNGNSFYGDTNAIYFSIPAGVVRQYDNYNLCSVYFKVKKPDSATEIGTVKLVETGIEDESVFYTVVLDEVETEQYYEISKGVDCTKRNVPAPSKAFPIRFSSPVPLTMKPPVRGQSLQVIPSLLTKVQPPHTPVRDSTAKQSLLPQLQM